MRLLSLAVFAFVALAVGVFKSDGMAIGLGVASGLATLASLPALRVSTFLELLTELFSVETVLFGVADLINSLPWVKLLEFDLCGQNSRLLVIQQSEERNLL